MHEPNRVQWRRPRRLLPTSMRSRRGEGMLPSCAHTTLQSIGPRGRALRPFATAVDVRRFLLRSATGALP